MDTRYDSDFFAWTQDQAAHLRRLAAERSNVELDLANLAEEVESMGSEQAHALESALMRIIEHLLKLEHSPARDPRNGWRRSVRAPRAEAARRLARNPSLGSPDRLAELRDAAWPLGRRLAVEALVDEDGIDPAVVPAECPYSVEQLLDLDWWPAEKG